MKSIGASLPGPWVKNSNAEKKESPGRLFLLFFWINEPVGKVDDVLDYFFNSTYLEGDRVILADQRHSLEINSVAEKEAKT